MEPKLKIVQVEEYEKIWDDRNTKSMFRRDDVSFFHPIPPSGFSILGSIAEPSQREKPSPNFRTFAVQSIGSDDLCRMGLRHLCPPSDLEMIWGDMGSGGKFGNASLWWPVPKNGYVALGVVAAKGYEKPPIDSCVCVRMDLVVEGEFGKCIWDSSSTSADMCTSLWEVKSNPKFAGISANLFFAFQNKHKPTFTPFTIDGHFLKL
eukprot:TRINITY_DN8917_c0_g1_i1.p1 TRINITY_DN8917_c0_g1~~TRINITY_DN8917_c0_g1_i1.p1  ORF type:complete len:220 (-),score=45.54 TRINITY_DN8917_c0_g1_i1:17-634(-)